MLSDVHHLTYHVSQTPLGPNDVALDIETTGLDRNKNHVFLISLLARDDANSNAGTLHQFYITDTDADAEKALLETALAALKDKTIVTFNGDRFDLPFLVARAGHVGASVLDLAAIDSNDLYKYVRKYRAFLDIENTKLKTVERLIGIDRADVISGAEVVKQFKAVQAGTCEMDEILLHNEEDVIYTAELLRLIPLIDDTRKVCIALSEESRVSFFCADNFVAQEDISSQEKEKCLPFKEKNPCVKEKGLTSKEKNPCVKEKDLPPKEKSPHAKEKQLSLFIEDVKADKEFVTMILSGVSPKLPIQLEGRTYSLRWDENLVLRVPGMEALADDETTRLTLGLLPQGVAHVKDESPYPAPAPFLTLRSQTRIFPKNVKVLLQRVLEQGFSKL